jgi:hypothetical protein
MLELSPDTDIQTDYRPHNCTDNYRHAAIWFPVGSLLSFVSHKYSIGAADGSAAWGAIIFDCVGGFPNPLFASDGAIKIVDFPTNLIAVDYIPFLVSHKYKAHMTGGKLIGVGAILNDGAVIVFFAPLPLMVQIAVIKTKSFS